MSVMLLYKSKLIDSEHLLLRQPSYKLRNKPAIFFVNSKDASRNGIQNQQSAIYTGAISRPRI
jgi:hypothetical protein